MNDLGASVLARLKNQAKETRLSYQTCLQLFFQEEFLRRLSKSQYCSNFILKGGLFIYTLTEFQSRATQDIDFLMRQLTNDLEAVKNTMEEIIQVAPANDYASIEVLSAEHITPDKDYQGVSVKFIGRIKQVRVPFSIDIGLDDVIVPMAVKRKLKTRLADFEEPQVYTYSIESTIAEKFDAILKRMEATSRMKDFFDIYYLSSMFDFEGELLTEAVWETIRHRGTPYDGNCFDRISAFRNNTFLRGQWSRFQATLKMELPEFEDVLDEIHQFLKPVFDSGVEERPFSMKWSAKKKQWVDARPEEV